jgi:hypothetical protein
LLLLFPHLLQIEVLRRIAESILVWDLPWVLSVFREPQAPSPYTKRRPKHFRRGSVADDIGVSQGESYPRPNTHEEAGHLTNAV